MLAEEEAFSVVREIEAFRLLASRSSIAKFFSRDEPFEQSLLGHSNLLIEPGPLTVAALGFDPPDGSTHFQLSLLGTDGTSVFRPDLPTAEERKLLDVELRKLDSRFMTVLIGPGLDCALVWEKRVEMLTYPPDKAIEVGLKAALPEGDFENDLRRVIDDSINILSDCDFNRQRIDNGKTPINLAWPWGHGERPKVPNRTLALGQPWKVVSSSLALRGLARLSGFKVENLGSNWRQMVAAANGGIGVVFDIDFTDLDVREEQEERAYRAEAIARDLILPLLESNQESGEPLVVVFTNPRDEGLIALARKSPNERDDFPLDERLLMEKNVLEFDLRQLMDSHG